MDRNAVSIAIEGDQALGLSYLPEAQQLLSKLRMQMAPGGIATARAYMDLPDGAYAYAISAMGIEAIRIVATSGASDQVVDAPQREPDFVSGVALKGKITQDVTGQFKVFQSFLPTNASALLHKLTPAVPQPIKRLVVYLRDALNTSGKTVPQLPTLKPTLYSGSMKEIVQLLLGFGRQNRKSIYEIDKSSVATESVAPTEYEREVIANGLQVSYDYRFYRTHGVTWDTTGKPWLIEISQRNGVLIMPLPVHINTTLPKFRLKLEALGDQDGLRVLDRFGGFPTGKSFPDNADSAVAAGTIFRLITVDQLQDFYRHTAYSSTMGWAFDAFGGEAHNTAFRYGDNGVQRGVHYCVTVAITGGPNPSGRATLTKSGEGNIWWPSRKGPQIKFPEPLIGGLLSHDMRPNGPLGTGVKCDTVMHVFFKGDELKVCKYYHDTMMPPYQEQSNFEDCMYVGQWESRTESERFIPSMFYTTDFDDREELAGVSVVTQITGKDLGYVRLQFGDDIEQLWRATVTREKAFKIDVRTTGKVDVTRKGEIAVPFGDREAYYYAKLDQTAYESLSVTTSYARVKDPYWYETWRYVSFLPQPRPHPTGCGLPTRRQVAYQYYEPFPCSDFADSGPWASICQDVERMAYDVALPPNSGSTTVFANKSKLTVYLVSDVKQTPFITFTEERVNDASYLGGLWFLPSPTDDGQLAYIAATRNAFGDASSLKYMENINLGPVKVKGKPFDPMMETEDIAFIGVVNA